MGTGINIIIIVDLGLELQSAVIIKGNLVVAKYAIVKFINYD